MGKLKKNEARDYSGPFTILNNTLVEVRVYLIDYNERLPHDSHVKE
jgi:hypothetical protein